MSTDKKDDSEAITGTDILDVLRSSDDPAVKAALEHGKVEMAESRKASNLQPWIDLILKANGIKSAWVSDRSVMGDFIPWDDDAGTRHQEVQQSLGMAFNLDDPVVDVARRLKSHGETPDLPN
jgi:hypothetical protein